MIQKLITGFCLGIISIVGYAQTEHSKYYELDNFRFYPTEKVVGVGGMVGGTTWDGYAYKPDTLISYDNTSLIFLNERYAFSEYLAGVDIASLQLVYANSGGRYLSLFNDKNAIYLDLSLEYYNTNLSEKLSLTAGHTQLNKYLYQDTTGNVYLLPPSYYTKKKLVLIDNLQLDSATLTHLADNYFYDKNGLYWLGKYRQSKGNEVYEEGISRQLATSTTGKIAVEDNLIIYGNHVFLRDYSLNYIFPLNLDINTLKQFGENIYTDGHNTYIYDKQSKALNGIELLEQLSNNNSDWIVDAKGDLYFKGSKRKGRKARGILFRTHDRYVLLDISKPSPTLSFYNNVFIYNYEAKSYSELDYTQYRYIRSRGAQDMYVYKNALYTYSQVITKTNKIDYDNLRPIKPNNLNVFCTLYTDGKAIFSLSDKRLQYPQDSIDTWYIVDFDTPSFKYINSRTAMDKDNIYHFGRNFELNVIPRDSLGIELKVFK